MTIVAVAFLVSVVVAGSALTLARRTREPCTACRKGEVTIARDFAYRCTACKARFVREHGALVRREL
jgi:hypothetical protein